MILRDHCFDVWQHGRVQDVERIRSVGSSLSICVELVEHGVRHGFQRPERVDVDSDAGGVLRGHEAGEVFVQ